MTKTTTIAALTNVLQTAFDESYLAQLETGSVSLDDELQHRLRVMIVTEVYGVLKGECERMGKADVGMHDYFVEQGPKEVDRRLKQELQGDQPIQTSGEGGHPHLVLLPSFEGAEG